jgi:hypothetical protein
MEGRMCGIADDDCDWSQDIQQGLGSIFVSMISICSPATNDIQHCFAKKMYF